MGELLITTGAIAVSIYCIYALIMVFVRGAMKIHKPRIRISKPNISVRQISQTVTHTVTRVRRIIRGSSNNIRNRVDRRGYYTNGGHPNEKYRDRDTYDRDENYRTQYRESHTREYKDTKSRFVREDITPTDEIDDFKESKIFY